MSEVTVSRTVPFFRNLIRLSGPKESLVEDGSRKVSLPALKVSPLSNEVTPECKKNF